MRSPEKTTQQTYQAILEALQNLIEVVAKLRSPEGGCPWDLAQTQKSLIPYIIEEAYEVADAIRTEEQSAIAEELGDLLLQVVLQAQIASDYGYFTLQEVAQNITEKLIRRHPHVFGELEVSSLEEVKDNWEKIKSTEKPENQNLSQQLQRYAQSLPPLVASSKISKKAAAVGFEWEDIQGVWSKYEEEFSEFKDALLSEDKNHQQAELGDLLFTLVNIARWYDLDCEEALQGTNHRFIQRLDKVEKLSDRPLSDYTLEELEQLWKQAKQQLAQ